jgi:hypothetical protein
MPVEVEIDVQLVAHALEKRRRRRVVLNQPGVGNDDAPSAAGRFKRLLCVILLHLVEGGFLGGNVCALPPEYGSVFKITKHTSPAMKLPVVSSRAGSFAPPAGSFPHRRWCSLRRCRLMVAGYERGEMRCK